MSKHGVVTGTPGTIKEPKFEMNDDTKYLADRWIVEQIFANNSGGGDVYQLGLSSQLAKTRIPIG